VPGRDSVERQHAAFVQVLVLALLPLLVALFLYGALTDAHALLTLARSTALLVLLLATMGAGVAVRRGRLGWAVGLLCGALLLAEAQTLLATGVAHDVPSVIPLVIPMTLAGLVRGRRALVLVAGLCIALVSSVALLESLHAPLVGTAPPERHPTATAVFIFVLVVIVLGLLLDRCGLALRTALAAAEQRAGELQGEIAVRTQAQEALQYQALHDALTGLPNRTLLHEHLTQALRSAQADQQPVALLLLDLDRFKEVNDTFGHQHGDLLLQHVATRLRAALRAGDIVARLGGDEFALLLPDTDEAGARRLAQGVQALLEAPILVQGQPLVVGSSSGIALAPQHGTDAATLLRCADVAMYVAKRAGGGYTVYDPAQDHHTQERLALVGALRQAIAQDALLLHYQPKVTLATGAVCGVEALVRWPHPQRGLIPPDEFIPLAEQMGLMAPLSAWVLEAAVRQAARWQHAGLELEVAVNLSVANLREDDLPAIIEVLLQRHGVAATRLRLELTESGLMADTARSLDVLARLAALGVGLSVDDYGTGYSSLAYLLRLPVDELKIDRSFLQQLAVEGGSDGAAAVIVRSTVELGHNLGLRVVAEGIEDATVQRYLAAWGCDVAQGYHWSAPLPAEMLAAYLGTQEQYGQAPVQESRTGHPDLTGHSDAA
jgi:diguanylate cyclase (GGDEF)-like protein